MASTIFPVAAGAVILATVGYYAASGTPVPRPRDNHAALVTKAQRAFCNCLKTRASLQECLASAEQGDGREVNDQELLLSRCLDGPVPEPRDNER